MLSQTPDKAELLNILELLLFKNDVSKELGLSLPIDSNSVTLMQKLTLMLKTAVTEHEVNSVVKLARVM
jgi:hypothetical protein